MDNIWFQFILEAANLWLIHFDGEECSLWILR